MSQGPRESQARRDQGDGRARRDGQRLNTNTGIDYGVDGNIYDQLVPGVYDRPDRVSGSRDRTSRNFAVVERSAVLRQKCQDPDCHALVAWRAPDDVGVGGRRSSTGGGTASMYRNQDERDIQMMLLDILSATGLPPVDLASGDLGSTLPAFSSLRSMGAQDAVSVPIHGIAGLGAGNGPELPQQRTRAWECARFAVERGRREWTYSSRLDQQRFVIASSYCEARE